MDENDNDTWIELTDDVTPEFHANILYPVTITQSRYGGVYEDGVWVCFPCGPEEVPEDAFGEDLVCMEWWSKNKHLCGVADTPNHAYIDLTKKYDIFQESIHVEFSKAQYGN